MIVVSVITLSGFHSIQKFSFFPSLLCCSSDNTQEGTGGNIWKWQIFKRNSFQMKDLSLYIFGNLNNPLTGFSTDVLLWIILGPHQFCSFKLNCWPPQLAGIGWWGKLHFDVLFWKSRRRRKCGRLGLWLERISCCCWRKSWSGLRLFLFVNYSWIS